MRIEQSNPFSAIESCSAQEYFREICIAAFRLSLNLSQHILSPNDILFLFFRLITLEDSG